MSDNVTAPSSPAPWPLPEAAKIKQSKVEAVVGRLRHAILSGAFPPGEWLRQDELAQRLGVSSTPVREALRRLEAEGLVEHVPHLGVKVMAYSLNTAREYYELRMMLEPYALRLAAQRMQAADLQDLEALVVEAQSLLARQAMAELTEANWRFHECLLRHCGSRLVQDVLARVRRSFQLDTLLMIPERAGASVSEHRRIVEALGRQDVAAAEREMQINIANAREAMLARLPALGVATSSPASPNPTK